MADYNLSLDEYRDRVYDLARKRKGGLIFNGSLDHSAIVVEHMFACARREVALLTGSLNPVVYGREEVIREARDFLASVEGARIRILLEEGDSYIWRFHPLLRELHPSRGLSVRIEGPAIRDHFMAHFMVVDDDCYRLEEDKRKVDAYAVFGKNQGSTNLKNAFNQLWNHSEVLRSP